MRRRNQGGDGATSGPQADGTDATVVVLTEFLAQRRAGQQLSPNHPSLRGARRREAQPETAQPETAQPESARPETARPETARPETAQPLAAPALPAQIQRGNDGVDLGDATRTAPSRHRAPTVETPAPGAPAPLASPTPGAPTVPQPAANPPVAEMAAPEAPRSEAAPVARHAARDAAAHAEGATDRDAVRDALTYELRYEDPEVETTARTGGETRTVTGAAPQSPPATTTRSRPTRVDAVEPLGEVDPVAAVEIPETARWSAGNGPRFFTGALLAMACLGVAILAVRFEASRTFDGFVTLAIGGGIAVGLWAILIVSAPQVVTLRGSVLTLHHRGGYERFDLADGLQPVDVLGDPRSSRWALLLHRPDCSSAVLRRRDVDAVELDPIVRHFRDIAEHRNAEREARFSR